MERDWTSKERVEIANLIMELEQKCAIRKCKTQNDQFISDIFVVPKPNEKFRLILNLKRLNKFIKKYHFKLEDGRTVTRLMSCACFMGSIDLKDAYYLIPISENHRKYLRFEFQGQLYEYLVLPFVLSVAPFVFTNLKL